MSPAEIRWRCERIAALLTHMGRIEAVVAVNTEAAFSPWLNDPRPAPPPMLMGTIHDGPIEIQTYALAYGSHAAHGTHQRKAA